ncbi:lipid II-degrading bacteriocin [Vreelandella glaciei]|uniref:lipid II-degrading bacteriocin n=1 Tax=Vreelandella glaciei TaxID=186761 RepID=UPI0030EF9FC6|tara:strand:+ start:1997 stop:3016 length:1020 start_codon:yes stop_codon:yes gene_type:complete
MANDNGSRFTFYDELDAGIPTDGHWNDDGTLTVTPAEGWSESSGNGGARTVHSGFEDSYLDDPNYNWTFYNAGHPNSHNVETGKNFYPNGEAQIELLSQERMIEFYESLYKSLGRLTARGIQDFLINTYTYNERGLIFFPKGYFETETATRDIGLSPYTLALEYGRAMNTKYDGIYNGESQNDFLAFALMDIVALTYWIWGEGKTRRLPAESLRLNWNQHSFEPITAVLNSSPGPGQYHIEGGYTYNIFNDLRDLPQAFALGQIVGNIQGTLTVNPDNSYIFEGSAVIHSGYYDANKGSGDAFREAATDVLRAIGEVFGHTDYILDTYGEVPLRFEGRL